MGHRLAEAEKKIEKNIIHPSEGSKRDKKKRKIRNKDKAEYETVKDNFNYTGSQKSLSILSSHVKR